MRKIQTQPLLKIKIKQMKQNQQKKLIKEKLLIDLKK